MTLRCYAAPAVEPLTVAEVMAHLRLDDSNQEPAPFAPTAALVSPAAAGNVDNGAHRYLATFVTVDGETQAGTPSAAVTVADKTVNGQVAVSGIPLGGSAVTARKLYRTLAGGGTYYLLATLADNTTTSYTDNSADASLGAGAPATNTTGDPLLNAFIVTARQMAEQATGRALVTQTWELLLDAFPGGDISLGLMPVQSVSSVKYYDLDGVLQTVDAADYSLDADALPGWVRLGYNKSWPSTQGIKNAVIVRFVAGYGAAADVPQAIKQWMLLNIGVWDQRRAGAVERKLEEVPRTFWNALLDPYILPRVA